VRRGRALSEVEGTLAPRAGSDGTSCSVPTGTFRTAFIVRTNLCV